MSELPPYTPSPAPPPPPPQPLQHSMSGAIQTCSIQDRQHDYYRITRDSPHSYLLSLTIDPTPLYRIELPQNPSSAADIQLFHASNSSESPIAACRLTPKPPKGVKHPKGTPVASICTSSPFDANTEAWIPVFKAGGTAYRQHYICSLPVVVVPGCKAIKRDFAWRFGDLDRGEPDVELWLREGLMYAPREGLDREQLFANYWRRGTRLVEKGVLEVRRGAGWEFEMGVVLGMLAVLEMKSG